MMKTIIISDSLESEPKAHAMEVNLFKVEERLPFIFSFLNAVQILICQVVTVIWLPLALTPSLCLLPADATRVNLVSSSLFVAGIVSSLQSVLGLRLPVIAAPSVLYTTSFLSLMSASEWQCPSVGDLYSMGPALRNSEWQSRIREFQGVLLLAGAIQAFLGYSGIQASLCRFFTPSVIAPSMILAGLSVFHQPLFPKDANFHIVTFCSFVILFIIFTFCLRDVSLPLPTFSMRNGLTVRRFPVFRMFPVIWTCITIYAMFSIFVPTPLLQNPEADAYKEAVDNSKWITFSIPFEWGLPTLSKDTAGHMLKAIFLQSLISMVMFYGNAETCDMSPPTRAAVRRGIGMEGLGVIFGSLWGQSVSINSDNIGLMSFTGIVSRSTTQLAAVLMVCLSHFPRITVWLIDIPMPVLTAIYVCTHIGLICVGFSLMKFVDLSSRRECFVVGAPLFVALSISQWTHHEECVFTHPLLLTTGSALLLNFILPGKSVNKGSHLQRQHSDEDKRTYKLLTWEELVCSVLERTTFFTTH